MLTDRQRAEFDDLGFVRIPDAFSADDAAAMRTVAWRELGHRYGIREDDRATWLEPFHVARLARKQKDAVVGEKDVLVVSSEVDYQRRITKFDELAEAGELRGNEHCPQRIPDNRRAHRASMPP